jgi:hypothetical protein
LNNGIHKLFYHYLGFFPAEVDTVELHAHLTCFMPPLVISASPAS